MGLVTFVMPANKKDTPQPLDQDAIETKKRMEKLAQAIRDEMGSLTREELERLYAVVAFMEKKKDV